MIGKKNKIKEENIRPRKLFEKFLKLAEMDSRIFFKQEKFFKINCPACSNFKNKFVFKKFNFSYQICPKCLTIFVNPRPGPEAFENYYRKGKSMEFLLNRIYKDTEKNRKRIVFLPKINYVSKQINKFFSKEKKLALVDIGAGNGTFCNEFLKNYKNFINVFAIEPALDLVELCKNRKIHLINKPLEKVNSSDLNYKSKKIFTCFELLEHVVNPKKFISLLKKLMKKNEILILTTLNGLGFDIQVLWEKSKYFCPPAHLNFFNPFSIELLFKKCGFEVKEITTPGELDWDIVEVAIKKEKFKTEKLWEYLANVGNEKSKQELQNWISENKLSSHMRVLVRK